METPIDFDILIRALENQLANRDKFLDFMEAYYDRILAGYESEGDPKEAELDDDETDWLVKTSPSVLVEDSDLPPVSDLLVRLGPQMAFVLLDETERLDETSPPEFIEEINLPSVDDILIGMSPQAAEKFFNQTEWLVNTSPPDLVDDSQLPPVSDLLISLGPENAFILLNETEWLDNTSPPEFIEDDDLGSVGGDSVDLGSDLDSGVHYIEQSLLSELIGPMGNYGLDLDMGTVYKVYQEDLSELSQVSRLEVEKETSKNLFWETKSNSNHFSDSNLDLDGAKGENFKQESYVKEYEDQDLKSKSNGRVWGCKSRRPVNGPRIWKLFS